MAKAIIFEATSVHGLLTHHKETFNFFLKMLKSVVQVV